KLSAESVRGRKAECAVQRSILSPGTAKLRRVQRTKQPKRSRGSGLTFASPLRRAQQKQGTATTRGKEFLSCAAGRNGFPLERGAFATRCFGLLHRLDGQHGLGRDAGGPVVDFAQLAELLADVVGAGAVHKGDGPIPHLQVDLVAVGLEAVVRVLPQ